MAKSRNTTMDIFKALACIGVVLIHITFPDPIGPMVRGLGRFSVPLFFAVSGFYLSSSEQLDSGAIARKLKHIAQLIVLSELGYLVFSYIFNQLYIPKKLDYFIEHYFSTGWVERFAITNAPPVYAHLWFMYALFMIYLLILLFIKRKRTLRILSILAPAGLVCIALFQEFSSLHLLRGSIPLPGASITTYWAHTIIFRALPFFLIGFCFREYNHILQKIPAPKVLLLVLIVLFEAASMWEAITFSVSQFYVGNMLAFLCILLLCIKYPQMHCKPLEYIGSRLSTLVYIIHVGVYKSLDVLYSTLKISKLDIILWTRPIIALIASILLAFVVDWVIAWVNKKLAQRRAKTAQLTA